MDIELVLCRVRRGFSFRKRQIERDYQTCFLIKMKVAGAHFHLFKREIRLPPPRLGVHSAASHLPVKPNENSW